MIRAVDEYKMILRYRALTSFFNHEETAEIRMEFVPRTIPQTLSKFEQEFLPLLETIRHYSAIYGADYVIFTIESKYETSNRAC